jgi:hypothetical protein
MNRPTVGFAGMTHLGLVSATAIASKGFPTICYDPDRTLIAALERGALPVVEPGLPELLSANGSHQRFSHQREALSACDIVYIATDVPTDDQGSSDLAGIRSYSVVPLNARPSRNGTLSDVSRRKNPSIPVSRICSVRSAAPSCRCAMKVPNWRRSPSICVSLPRLP